MATGDDDTRFQQQFTDRLNALWDKHHRPDGKIRSNAEIVSLINGSDRGVTMTEAYLSNLRHGKGPVPRLDVAAAIALAFGEPPTYFLLDDADLAPPPDRGGLLDQDPQPRDDVDAELRDRMNRLQVSHVATSWADAERKDLERVKLMLLGVLREIDRIESTHGDGEPGSTQRSVG